MWPGLSIILLLVIAVPLFLKFIVFAPKEDLGAPVAKDEALQGTQQQDNSIAAMQKRMEQDKAQKRSYWRSSWPTRSARKRIWSAAVRKR
ncbi:hypothetical protein BC497_29575 (plasmid) [Klebsiella variicola]|uniref:hypothetical protein n=1 Tax=Klebsiella variicola TaxID=244366 RepID=UPI000E35C1C4|nr:hypothetical protein [Klebsiella variicola]AXO74127.1 hypothetical protein BC497_29575 [Klebsiella variicola]